MPESSFFKDRLAGYRVPTNDVDGLMDCARYNEENDALLLTEYLSSHPDDINVQDGQGRTAVHMAAANGHIDILELLMGFNPKPNMQNEEGNTALHFAALNNRLDAAKLLLNKGWSASIKNNSLKTPLQLISQEKGVDEMEALLMEHDESLDNIECVMRDGEPDNSPSPPKPEGAAAKRPAPGVKPAPKPAPKPAAPEATKEGLIGSNDMEGCE